MVACSGGDNPNQPENSSCGDDVIEVQLENVAGFDGCTWLLYQASVNERMEAINLQDFIPDPQSDKLYRLTVIDRPDMASSCMAGRITEITCVE